MVNVIFYVAKWSSLFTFLLVTNVVSVRIAHCTKNHIFFLQMFCKDCFFKISHWKYDLSCIIREYGIFFPKIWSYSLDGKWKMIFLKKYLEIWYFLYIWYRRYFFFLQIWYYLSVKKAKMIFSRKSALKDDISGKIEKDDVHPRKLVFLLIEKLKMIQKFTFIKKFQKFSVLL